MIGVLIAAALGASVPLTVTPEFLNGGWAVAQTQACGTAEEFKFHPDGRLTAMGETARYRVVGPNQLEIYDQDDGNTIHEIKVIDKDHYLDILDEGTEDDGPVLWERCK